MKRILAILLFSLYTLSSSGLSVQLHFCCGELKSMDWSISEKECCEKETSMPDECCEVTELSDFDKPDENQLPLKSADQIATHYFLAAPTFYFTPGPLVPSISSSPHEGSTPLYILHCVYQI